MDILVNPYIKFCHAGLFHSEKLWIHPRRTEITYEIIYVTEGEVYMCDGGREICAVAGQLMILEPGTAHFGYRESRNVGFYWLHFSLCGGTLPFEARFLNRFDSAYLFRELLHYNNLPNKPEYEVNSVLVHILSEIRRLSEESGDMSQRRAGEIYEWIRANADARLSVSDVARRFEISADHVSRLLNKSCGKGAKAIIDMFVIKKAKELLCNTNKYIKEIAFELEFCSEDAFTAFFKYHENIYPGAYRNRYFKTHMNSK